MPASTTSSTPNHAPRALPPMWLVVASVLAFVTLLLSFDHVVRQGVQTAELRRQNAAAQSAAVWRCQSMRDTQSRSDCLASVPALGGLAAPTDVAAAYASF